MSPTRTTTAASSTGRCSTCCASTEPLDNLTHSLVGVALGRAGLERRYGKGTIFTLVIASNLPDLDALLTLPFGALSFAIRRGITHSVFGLPVLCLLLAWLARLRYPHQPVSRLFGLALLGAGFHVGFDFVNSYGVMLLHPFSRQRWELGCVFIIDLALWAILLGMVLVPRIRIGASRWWNDRQAAARGACLLVVAYLIATLGLRHRAGELLTHAHDRDHAAPAADFAYVFPEPLGPHRWKGVHRHASRWELWRIHALGGRVELVQTIPTDPDHPQVLAVRSSPAGRTLETFWKAPVWTVSGTAVLVRDLRFTSTVISRLRSPFSFRFTVSPDGSVAGPVRN